MDLHLGQSIVPNKQEDFEYFRSLCENEEGWNLHYDSDVTVYSRDYPGTSKCIRVRGNLRDINADTVFDCLNDGQYRERWDTVAVSVYDIHHLDKHTNLGYYCLKCPFPFQNRDVVFQRAWSPVTDGYVIMNHSIELPTHPPIPGIVRATSHITGYLMVNTDYGCRATYLSHSDPKIALPQWLCNKVGTYLAPGVFRSLFAAAGVYEEWKKANRPEYKPWRWEEQRKLDDYADAANLLQWGFPLPPAFLKEKELENTDSDDNDSFHSLDEDVQESRLEENTV